MVSPVLEDAWNTAQPRLKQIQAVAGKSRSRHAIRVTQLDAELLDQELVQLLLEPILALINVCYHSACRILLLIDNSLPSDHVSNRNWRSSYNVCFINYQCGIQEQVMVRSSRI
jgi:hypothetical protein